MTLGLVRIAFGHPTATASRCAASSALLAALLTAAFASGAATTGPQHPFPQHVADTAGSLLPNHRTQAQRDADARSLYDAWKSRYLSQAGVEADGHPRYRVRQGRAQSARTVSEAQGYGLILTVLFAGHDLDARAIFDGLLEFALDHPSQLDARLMDWSVPADEALDPGGNDSAFDADADIAYALLLAARQWGDAGRFDYSARAQSVMSGQLASVIGPATRLPMLGDWVNPSGASYSEHTPRISDFLPDHFRAFADASGAAAWDEVRTAVQSTMSFVQGGYAPATGLVPDFLEPVSANDPTLRPADPNFLESAWDGDYYYNSTRVPLRLAIDALLNADAISREQVAKLSLWAESASLSNPALLRAGYALDGTPLDGSDYFTTAFAAPLGPAARTAPSQQQWLNALYDAARVSDEDYYEDTLSLLSVLVMTGNYWSPTRFAPQPVEIPGLSPLAASALMAGLLASGLRALGRSGSGRRTNRAY